MTTPQSRPESTPGPPPGPTPGPATPPYALPPPSWVDLGGPVHYLDHGGPADGPLAVLVHGLGGSALNWSAIAPGLSSRCRVLAVDLAGFGRTPGGRRSTSVTANRLLLHRFLTEVSGTPVILVGNSMGGLISILQTDAAPSTVAGLALVDPAVPFDLRHGPDPLVTLMFSAYTVPAVGRRLLRLGRSVRSSDAAAGDLLRLCCADPDRVPPEVVRQHLALAKERHGDPDVDAELLAAARSLVTVLTGARRVQAAMARISVPVLLLHGTLDRLVPINAARRVARANPHWRTAFAEGIGHVPQLEAPEWTLARIEEWLDTDARVAADLARHPQTD